MKTNNIGIYPTMALLWIGHFLVDFMIGIWPVYKTMLQLDLAKAGLIAGGCAFIGEGMQALFGALSDKGYRKALIIAGIIGTASSAFFAYTQDYMALFLLYLTTCLGSGAFHPSAVSLTSSLSANRKGLFIAIFASGGALGLATSQLVFSNTHFFLQGNTFFLAIPTICLVAYIVFSRFAATNTTKDSVKKKLDFSAHKQFFQNKELLTLYLLQVCNQTVFWALVFLLPDILMLKGYEEWICFGGGHLFLILGGAVMMVPGGYLADKYSSRTIIVMATITSLFSFYAFLLTSLVTPFALFSLLFVMGASLGVVSPVAIALGNRLMTNNPGTVSACLMGLVLCIAECIGIGGGGVLTKVFTENAPTKALAVLGLFFILGITAGIRLPHALKEKTEYA